VQWLFNKGLDDQGRQHVHAVISGADEWMDLDESEIVSRVVQDVHHAIPGSVGLQPIEARSIKEKRATFAATPGLDSFRPSAGPGFVGAHGGGVENLLLAGDWTDTGWPATMEGAVRSGYAAAAAVLGDDRGGLVEDVPTGSFARVLGLRWRA
jgi:zeta-carotene desaturase